MSERRKIAEAGAVTFNPDGSRTVFWPKEGLTRSYTQDDLAQMFLDAIEQGETNPLLDRLLRPEEMREMYAALQVLSEDMADLVLDLRATAGVVRMAT